MFTPGGLPGQGERSAPAIGTAHGVYKTKTPKLDFDRLEKSIVKVSQLIEFFNNQFQTNPDAG